MHRDEAQVTDAFINSKRDKRTIKHSSFVSRIGKARRPAAASSSSSKKNKNKKRRAAEASGKGLAATLQGLAEALPELTEEDGNIGDLARGRVRHRSLKSRPGALRKKERLVRGEMARFGASLAQLSSVREVPAAPAGAVGGARGGGDAMDVEEEVDTQQQQAVVPQQSTANRFAALRGFISATMEQNPAFSRQGP